MIDRRILSFFEVAVLFSRQRLGILLVLEGCLLSTVAILLALSLRQTQGVLVYPLDDPYIHMAIAKNLFTHGSWSVDNTTFTSSSSSPLWVLLLTCAYYLSRSMEWIPLAINILVSIGAVAFVFYWLSAWHTSDLGALVITIGFVYLTPLPTLVLTGQEHVFHVLVTLAFVLVLVEVLSKEKPNTPTRAALLLLAPLLTSIRYEGVFLLLAAFSLLSWRRRFRDGVACLVVGLLPILLYGIVSLGKGWFFVPSPLLLKGSMPPLDATGVLQWGVARIKGLYFHHIHVLFLVLFALAAALQRLHSSSDRWRDRPLLVLAVFLLACIPHILFAGYGWFFRYEAYLVGLGLVALGLHAAHSKILGLSLHTVTTDRLSAALALVFILLSFAPFFGRGIVALRMAPKAVKNIYEQQYQMAAFVKKFYDHEIVAANDIGAICFYNNVRLIDLWGLASKDVAVKILSDSYDTKALRDLAVQTKPRIIVLYESYFQGHNGPSLPGEGGRKCPSIPAEWIKVGAWRISGNVVCGSDRVTFYVSDDLEKDRALKYLQEFSGDLPVDVIQEGL